MTAESDAVIRQRPHGVAAAESLAAEGKAAGVAGDETAGVAENEAAGAAGHEVAIACDEEAARARPPAGSSSCVPSCASPCTPSCLPPCSSPCSPPCSSSCSSSGAPPSRAQAGRSLKGRALAFLSRREYSRAELFRKLKPFADDADALNALLDALAKDGWLSDERFAESLVHRRAAKVGSNRIVSELKQHAVDDGLIEAVGARLRETELARAQAVWQKKYGQLPATPAERARQARFLAARGFSLSVIGKILKGLDEDWCGD